MYKNIWNDIILLNLKDFENIGVDFYINIFSFALTACICCIAVLFELNRGNMSLTVKQLFRHNAINEQNAKTLKDIGLSGKRLIKYSLCHKSGLSMLVARVGAPDITYEDYIKLTPARRRDVEKFDINTAAFYIPEQNSERARRIYQTYGFSLPRIVLFCLLILILWALITVFSYEIICGINTLLGKA